MGTGVRRRGPRWRAAFLRALRRTGNVTAAAGAAGVDKSTAYLRRKGDAAFAAHWEAARAAGSERLRTGGYEGPGRGRRRKPRPGGEEILRRGRDGNRLVKASAERWNRAVNDAFFACLGRTACIARACAEAGISREAVDRRRKAYPEFDADVRAATQAALEKLHRLVVRAGIATLDPEKEGLEAPTVKVSEAIAILRLKGTGGPGAAAALGARPACWDDGALPPIEAVEAEVLRRIEAVRAHREGLGDGD